MGRRRKISVVDEEKENEDSSASITALQSPQNAHTATNPTLHNGPMNTIMTNVQLNETFHDKYIREMQQLYAKMDHDAFIFTFIKMIKSAMEADECNDYANTTLHFCAKFVSSYNGDDTHPVLVNICKWMLTTISNNPHIRFRLCQFVNMILNALGTEAALDDAICDNIMEYMLARLRDISPSVRVQAILALQRLQIPDNPDDPVLRSYQFHLCSDPSPRVRQAVITSMGRNYNTIPYILDRLWDIDEKVRRHTYLHMSSYPVRSYKVSQRLTLLEQGLNDRSDMVRKMVITIMLQQWIESYQKNLILLVSGLKLDSNEAEIDRFRKITKLTLKEIFKRQSKNDLVACIPLVEEAEFHRCVPHEKLTIEISLYWQCLAEYLQSEMADELDQIVPELSTFCAYVERYCQVQRAGMDKFELMEFQYILLSLMEILYTFDLGDEIGRDNLKKLLTTILKGNILDEKIILVIVKCAENLITDQIARFQYFVEIIQEICDLNTKHTDLVHDRHLINDLISKSSDAALNLKLSSLKVKILDLEEQEMNFVQKKDYVNAQKITDEKNVCADEYTVLLKPLIEQHSSPDLVSLPFQQSKKVTNESILKSLQIAFHMVVSKNVQSLTPNVCKLYNDFICRHIASNQIATRDWALKCGTAYSLLYEPLAKDVFDELYLQFYKNHNIRIWKTAIDCIFELLDRYGMDNFVVQEPLNNKSKKAGRQLYNTLEVLDNEDDTVTSAASQGVGVIFMMSHFLDTCDDVCIMSAIVKGFCRMILRGHIKRSDIIEKLLLRYFNPTTDAEVNQILGVFLENLIQRKKQDLLYPCLLPTVATVMSATYDNALQELKPETIMRFVIDATRQEFCLSDANIHVKLAKLFLQEMQIKVDNKELCKLLAKEIVTLELNVRDNPTLKSEMKDAAEKLIKVDFDPKTLKYISDFKDMLDGIFNPTLINVNENGSDDEDKSDDETGIAQKHKEQPESNQEDKQPAEKTLNCEPAEKTVVEKTQRLPSTPKRVAKTVSPSASAPTTYGRENTVGLRYLRKSLNTSRNNSISESGDGPSRSPKIRIEARIDSDKKAAQSKEQKKSTIAKVRTRRNLRLNANEIIQKEIAQNHEDCEVIAVVLPTDVMPTPTNPKANHKEKTPDKSKQTSPKLKDQESANDKEKTSDGMKKTPAKKRVKESEKGREKPAVHGADNREEEKIAAPALRTTRRRDAAAITAETGKKTTTASSPAVEREIDVVAEKLNNSDIIAASPSPDNVGSNTTRLRRLVRGSKLISMRPTRSNSIVSLTTAPSSPKVSVTKTSSKEIRRSISTPLRNGRKRVLHYSPKVSSGSDNSVQSPLRKRSKINSLNAIPDNTETELLPRTVQSELPIPTGGAGSPSSTKGNEITVKLSNLSIVVSSVFSTADENNDGDVEMSSQSDGTTSSKRVSLFTAASSLSGAGNTSKISTRNMARMERQTKTIMTRKRLSMENLPTSSAKLPVLASSSTLATRPSRLRKVPSKIPVRTMPLSNKTSSSTISESTSTSSGAEDSTNTKIPRRKALATKMTRINLATSRAGPVPMRLARPTRAQTPISDGPSGTRISRRRVI